MFVIPKFLRRGHLLPIFRKTFPSHRGVTIFLPQHQIKFYIADTKDRMQSMIYYFNEYEPHTTRSIIDNLSEGDCFFDIGSSVGYFSLIAAKIVGPDGRVHAFEPLPRNYEAFKMNRTINNFDNIIINNKLVIDRVGSAIFYPPNDPDEWGTGSIFGGNRKEAFSIPSVTLEDYIKSQNVENITLMKIDTEGSELKIIDGLKPVIADVGYPKIICEVNETWLKAADAKPSDLISSLRDLGYKIYRIGRKRLMPLGNDFNSLYNIFAVH